MHAPALTKAAIYCVALKIDQSLIADLPVFEGLSPEALEDIFKRAHARHYAKGVAVFSQNETAHSFFLLLHGRLRVTQVTPHGEQIVVRFVSPGDLFGVAMALGRSDYPGTATAIVDSLALLWPSAAWPEMIGRHPALAGQCDARDRWAPAGCPSASAGNFNGRCRAARRPRGSQTCRRGRQGFIGGDGNRFSAEPPGYCGNDSHHFAHC